jgi:uncharacterized damage-inducible protein DinB
MNLPTLHSLYSYNAWANGRILLTADQITDLQLKRQPVAGLSALRDILVHTLNAQAIWLARWRGLPPVPKADPQDFPHVAVLRLRWAEVEGETQAFLSDLQEAELERMVHYSSLSGKAFANPLWQLMLHQVNHATQHRSEAAVLLSLYNFSPGDLDYIVYLRLVEEGRAGSLFSPPG